MKYEIEKILYIKKKNIMFKNETEQKKKAFMCYEYLCSYNIRYNKKLKCKDIVVYICICVFCVFYAHEIKYNFLC